MRVDQRLIDKWLPVTEFPPKCPNLDNCYYCLGYPGSHCEEVGVGKVYSCDVSISCHVFRRMKNVFGCAKV